MFNFSCLDGRFGASLFFFTLLLLPPIREEDCEDRNSTNVTSSLSIPVEAEFFGIKGQRLSVIDDMLHPALIVFSPTPEVLSCEIVDS